ncbi:hypothetical protein [Sphingobium cupriresistens]|uniref:hypothetical protein n=1 Tax=Sphingobium cupriresistens TaxID=1132417 RepID=UPI000A90D498|nr:hypothetical protein [Sphingobium cupriresistens]
MRGVLLFLAATVGIATPSHAEQKIPKAMQKWLSMTPDDFQGCINVADDSLDVTAKLSSESCFKETQGLLKIVWNDNFIRAFVDKKTGKATYQVYQYISYQSPWRFYTTVNYETPDGPKSELVTEIARNVVSCSGGAFSSGCTLSEHVAFNADEALLKTIALKFSPGQVAGWRFKFGSKAGGDWQDGISAGEVGGILKAVDRYRLNHNLPR